MARLRQITAGDIAASAELYANVFNGRPWNDHWTKNSARKRLLDICRAPRFFGIACETKEGLQGALFGNIEVWYDTYHFQLKEMFIDPRVQRTGIGTLMIELLKTRLAKKHVVGIYLSTSTDRWTEGFYTKNGFKTVRSMQIMKLTLPPMQP